MPIVLVGMIGSGKSTIGRKLARKLDLKFYDSDKILEERVGLSIVDIHDFMGTKYFLEIEEQVIKEVLSYGVVVLSTGGNSLMNQNIRESIKKNAVSIWLNSSLETLYSRIIKRNNTRPELIGSNDKKDLLKKLLMEREPILKCADIEIGSDTETYLLVNEIIEKLSQFLKNKA